MKRDETKELGRTCICMEPWMLDGALHGTLGAGLVGELSIWIREKQKVQIWVLDTLLPELGGGKPSISSDRKQIFYLGRGIGDVISGGLNSGNLDIGNGGNEWPRFPGCMFLSQTEYQQVGSRARGSEVWGWQCWAQLWIQWVWPNCESFG